MTDAPDNPELTADDFARMRPASEVLSPKAMDAFRRGSREVLGLDDFTEADLAAIRAAEPPPE